MKIGYFTDIFPCCCSLDGNNIKEGEGAHFSGGMGRVVYNLLVQMSKKGHEVYVFTAAARGVDSSVECHENMTVVRYKPRITIGSSSISPSILLRPSYAGVKLDIVHAHMGYFPAAMGGYFYSKIHRVPFVLTHHGDVLISQDGSRIYRMSLSLSRYMFDFFLKRCDQIIALSEGHCGDSDHLPKYRHKISIIPNGVNIEDFQVPFTKEECRRRLGLPYDKKILLFVGSLTERKGSDILLKAFEKVHRQDPDVAIIFVGDGPQRSELEEYVLKNNVDSVYFAGFVDGITKSMYYRSADLFVLPSLIEAFPLVLLEASASGLPMIVSDIQCMHAIVEDRINGIFALPGNEEDLAEKILNLLNDDGSMTMMGANAFNKVKQGYSWENIAEKTEDLYRSVLHGLSDP